MSPLLEAGCDEQLPWIHDPRKKGAAPIYRKFAIVYAVAHSVKGGALIDRKFAIVYHLMHH